METEDIRGLELNIKSRLKRALASGYSTEEMFFFLEGLQNTYCRKEVEEYSPKEGGLLNV